MPLHENDTPEMEVKDEKFYDEDDFSELFPSEEDKEKKNGIKSFFNSAKDWFAEKFDNIRSSVSNAIEKIKEKLPHLAKPGGALDRLETRILGGREAYNKIYSQVSKEEADKAVFQKENLPSTLEEKARVDKEIGKNNGKEIFLQDDDLNKRYIANAYTINVKDMQGSIANYTVKSADELNAIKIAGKESTHGLNEMLNVSHNNETFKALVNKFKVDIADNKEPAQIFKGKSYENKDTGNITLRGSFDVDRENIVKVTCTTNKDNTVDLSLYNFTNKSSLEIKGAPDFASAIINADELLKASERSAQKFTELFSENKAQENEKPLVLINTNSLAAKDIIETKNGKIYEIQDVIETKEDEKIFSCRSLIQNSETGFIDYASRSPQTVEISENDIKDIRKDIQFESSPEKSDIETVEKPLKEGTETTVDKSDSAEPKNDKREWTIGDIAENYKGERFAVVGVNAQSSESLKHTQLELAPYEEKENGSIIVNGNESFTKDANQGLSFVETRRIERISKDQELPKINLPEQSENAKISTENSSDKENNYSEHNNKNVVSITENKENDLTKPKESIKDEKISVGDIVNDGKHNYRITKIDAVSQSFHTKSVSFNESKGYWLSEENAKTNKISLERENEFSVIKKAGEKPKVNDVVITDDGKVGTLTKANKKIGTVNIDGHSLNYHFDTLQKYEPPQQEKNVDNSKEENQEKDPWLFEAGGSEEEPTLENASEYISSEDAIFEENNMNFENLSIEDF